MLCMNRLDVLSHLEIDASRHEVRADEDPNLTSPEALNDIIALILKWCERRETPLRETKRAQPQFIEHLYISISSALAHRPKSRGS